LVLRNGFAGRAWSGEKNSEVSSGADQSNTYWLKGRWQDV